MFEREKLVIKIDLLRKFFFSYMMILHLFDFYFKGFSESSFIVAAPINPPIIAASAKTLRII